MTVRSLRRSIRALTLVTVCAAASGCTTRVIRPTGEMAGLLPVLSVERFLQAANAGDWEAMRQLFGTVKGPIEGDRREIELRMSAISEILKHDDYRIMGDTREPGREHPTTRVTVTITKGGRQFPDVPFLVVQTDRGGWLIEQVDLERITRG